MPSELYHRLDWAHFNLEPKPTDWRIVWEDPDNPDLPLHITGPAPEFMAALLHGGIVPPVEVVRTQNREWIDAAEPLGPLTEEQAMEWIMCKDVPDRVWGRQHNRPMFRFVKVTDLPADRTLRNLWRLAMFDEPGDS